MKFYRNLNEVFLPVR